MTSFKKELAMLEGLKCWGVIAGTGSGSMVTIELGGRVRRGASVKNENISDELRNYCGEFCVFVEGCAWRVEDNATIVCGWNDDEATIREKMDCLVGCKLTKAELSGWALDLTLSFDERYFLRLFCDRTAGTLDNYSIRFPSGWYSVRSKSKLSWEATDSN
jgi:hypothetical protein